MTKVTAGNTVSLDGYIMGPTTDPGEDWATGASASITGSSAGPGAMTGSLEERRPAPTSSFSMRGPPRSAQSSAAAARSSQRAPGAAAILSVCPS